MSDIFCRTLTPYLCRVTYLCFGGEKQAEPSLILFLNSPPPLLNPSYEVKVFVKIEKTLSFQPWGGGLDFLALAVKCL